MVVPFDAILDLPKRFKYSSPSIPYIKVQHGEQDLGLSGW
jgi:hypothetical protein